VNDSTSECARTSEYISPQPLPPQKNKFKLSERGRETKDHLRCKHKGAASMGYSRKKIHIAPTGKVER